ncbi:MAG: T9SS type A sorting domain-containing protein, partial [candidate division WOR-3 bacterium]
KSVPKTGASLAYAGSRVWLIKGNKLNEFWQYVPEGKSNITNQISDISQAIQSNPIEILKFNLDIRPNPFIGLTTISYTVPISAKVSIKLYDATGRLVKTVTNEYLNAGVYTKTLSSKTLAKGVYFLRYNDNTNQKQIKLIAK